MLRDTIFRSGVPLLLAAAGLCSFGYIALVRRERLAGYWAVAWALLIARYALNMWYGSVTSLSVDVAASVLRIGFAVSVCTGVLALRGRVYRTPWLVAGTIALGATGHVVRIAMQWEAFGAGWARAVMVLLLASAAIMLWRTETLPALERRCTALALAGYTVCSLVAPGLPDGSSMLGAALMGSWVMLLGLSFGLMTVFFRLALDGERTAAQRVEQYLAAALGEFVSVCMHCRAVRDAHDSWQPLERFVSRRGSTALSHGLCPSCVSSHYEQPGDRAIPITRPA